MAKYRKKSVVIEAHQWFKSGDHPNDDRETFCVEGGEPFLGEGKIVRYYRTPSLDGQLPCPQCGDIMHNHGWIDEGIEGRVVCPGDWILTEGDGSHYPCKPDIFTATYEPAS